MMLICIQQTYFCLVTVKFGGTQCTHYQKRSIPVLVDVPKFNPIYSSEKWTIHQKTGNSKSFRYDSLLSHGLIILHTGIYVAVLT